ncbi:hypothetical protein EYV94_03840 [Puteibacter caeruleilacunae]|nr:hypothetical protein EYV94_03840 [Puteibacter caeruleilacunae]
MKKIIFSLLVAIAFCFGGCEDTNENLIGQRGVPVVPGIEDLAPAFFDLKSLESTFVGFNVVLSEGVTAEKVVLYVSFNGQGERKELATLTSFPAAVTVSAADAAGALGLNTDDIELGDVFNIETLTYANGETTWSVANVNANVACASDIAGTYSLTATGQGGGGLGGTSPWTAVLTTAEIVSKDGGVTYTIEPALAGIMVDYYAAYGATTVQGEFQDICGTITNAKVHDGWNPVSTYSGSIDEATGVITINFENNWGDGGEMILTPQ